MRSASSITPSARPPESFRAGSRNMTLPAGTARNAAAVPVDSRATSSGPLVSGTTASASSEPGSAATKPPTTGRPKSKAPAVSGPRSSSAPSASSGPTGIRRPGAPSSGCTARQVAPASARAHSATSALGRTGSGSGAAFAPGSSCFEPLHALRATAAPSRLAAHSRRPERGIGSERDVVVAAVVLIVVAAATSLRCFRLRSAVVVAAAGALGTTAATAARAAREDHVVGDHLGAVALVAFLVVVARGRKAALDEQARPLVQDLAQRFPALSPDHDAVPVRALLPDLVSIEVGLARRQP